MNRREKTQVLTHLGDIPQGAGVFFCYQNKTLLYAHKTANLQRAVQSFFNAQEPSEQQQECIERTLQIGWQRTDSLLEAHCVHKLTVQHLAPEYNHQLHTWESYVYLAVNFGTVPYLKVADSTLEEAQYIGPFPDRFFVYEVIDVLADAFGYPSCADETYPCNNLKEGTCKGWCVEDQAEVTAILQHYLHPEQSLLQTLQSRAQALLDELEFAQAEQVQSQLRILQRYYRHLRFCIAAKYLDAQISLPRFSLQVTAGCITAIRYKENLVDFGSTHPQYRPNEQLALEKSAFDELYIVASYLEKHNPAPLDAAFKKGLAELDRSEET
jgi:excinuclease UvrABC nuclease subunit